MFRRWHSLCPRNIVFWLHSERRCKSVIYANEFLNEMFGCFRVPYWYVHFSAFFYTFRFTLGKAQFTIQRKKQQPFLYTAEVDYMRYSLLFLLWTPNEHAHISYFMKCDTSFPIQFDDIFCLREMGLTLNVIELFLIAKFLFGFFGAF